MPNLKQFEKAAETDLRAAFVREFIPLAIIVAVAVGLQFLTHLLLSDRTQ